MNNTRILVGNMALISLIITIISVFWRDNLLTAALLAALLAVTLWFWHTRRDITHFFVVAFVGSSTEAICIYFGAWAYSNPTFLVPLWLPLAWGLAGIALPKLVRCLIKPGGAE